MTFSRALRILAVCLLALFFFSAAHATAGSLTLAWDPSPEPGVAGYTLAYGTQSGNYTGWIDVGDSTSYTVSLADGNYYFAVRAYTHDGVISSFSNEVLASVGVAGSSVSSTCTTPDPFVSLGGGTCYLGGWLPPGTAPTGSNITQPAPGPSPAPAPSGSTGCTTPDPFAAMGGGTCYNGGWLPPGMPIPSGTTQPAPTPTPAPAPSPTPSTPQGCFTPDPFAVMGGGTCYNGGWLPPGMAVPDGTATSSTIPAETPTEPTESPFCTTLDPFAALGGGTCYNGGWLPPGMAVTVTGTLSVISLQDALWVIEGEDGTIYASPTELAPELLVDGATVTFEGLTFPSSTGSDGVVTVDIIAFDVHR